MSHSTPGPRDPAIGALRAGQAVTVRTGDGVISGELRAGDLASLILGDRYIRYGDGTTAPGILDVTLLIATPGLYDAIPEDVYHAGRNTPTPSLSNSSMSDLIDPSTPAHFRWNRDNPSGPKRVFDVGRAAHARVLGAGEEMASCPVEYLSVDGKMTTLKAKAWAAEQRANGIVPLRPEDYLMVCGMADALAEHPTAGEILTGPAMRPEVSAYAQDELTGVWLRGRFDILGDTLADYKTAASAHPDAFRRSAWSYGYHRQQHTYRMLHRLATGEPAGRLLFIVQEKVPPYLVSLIELDDEFDRLAAAQVRQAIDLYAECLAADSWPGYRGDVVTITPPPWARTPDDYPDPDTEDADPSGVFDYLASLERTPT